MPRRSVPPRWQSYSWLLINTVVWGASLVIVKPALEFVTPFRYLWYRYLIATVLSLPILAYYWPKLSDHWHTVAKIVAIELLGTTVGLGLLYIGLSRAPAVEVSLIATTEPVFVVLAGLVILKEKEDRHEWLGLALACIGAILLTVVPGWQTGAISFSGWFSGGGAIMLLYNLVTAAYFILAKKYFASIPKFFATAVSFGVGLITFGFLSWWELGLPWSSLPEVMNQDWHNPAVRLACIYMATFGSIIGLTAYLKGQDGIEASEASLFWYLQPFVYIPLAWWWLKETVTPYQLIALTFILGGVVVAEWRTRRRRRLAKHKTTSRSRS